jgi:GTP-binding protein
MARRSNASASPRSRPSAVSSLQEIDEAQAGDIVTLAGMSKATVADTICALAVDDPLPAQPIDPPTISVTFGINDSPLAGRDGKKVQSRVIRERLMKEAESNVAIRVADTPGGEAFEVSGAANCRWAS